MNANDRLNAMQARCDAASPAPWDYAGQGWVRHGDMTIGSDQFPEVLAATTSTDADGVFIAAARTDLPSTIAALRAVLDLHQPVLDILPWLPRHPAYCGECSDDEVVTYPCPTVRAITEALT